MSDDKPRYVYTKGTYKDKRETNGVESERLTVFMTPDQAIELAETLMKVAEDNGEEGVRFIAYTGPRKNRDTGEVFNSTCFSVTPRIRKSNATEGSGRQDSRSVGTPATSSPRVSESPTQNQRPGTRTNAQVSKTVPPRTTTNRR